MTLNKALEKGKDKLAKEWIVKNDIVDASNPKTQQAVKSYVCEALREAGFVALMVLVGSTWQVKKP